MLEKFKPKKRHILGRLARTDGDYLDASPKGSVDEEIRDLVAEINLIPELVTTSSCAGRVAVYLEGGPKHPQCIVRNSDGADQADEQAKQHANGSTGGKGGGRWLFTSHTPVDLTPLSASGAVYKRLGFASDAETSYPKPEMQTRFIHFKFEPMILHILAESHEQAQAALSAAMTAGFRESGISGIFDSRAGPTTPRIAVRSSGLGLDSIIGFYSADSSLPVHRRMIPMVPEAYLRTLIEVANERFEENLKRKDRFRSALLERTCLPRSPDRRTAEGRLPSFEPAAIRKERKRREGLLAKEQSLAFAGALDGPSDRMSEREREPEDEDDDLCLDLFGDDEVIE